MYTVPAKPEDGREILEIRQEVRAVTYEGLAEGLTQEYLRELNPVTPETIAAEEARIEDSGRGYWVARQRDTLAIVGYLRTTRGHLQVLDTVHVLPQHQHKGVGHRLLELALDDFDSERQIFLTVVDGNLTAQKWYQQYGWQPTGNIFDDEGTPLPGGGFLPELEMVRRPFGSE